MNNALPLLTRHPYIYTTERVPHSDEFSCYDDLYSIMNNTPHLLKLKHATRSYIRLNEFDMSMQLLSARWFLCFWVRISTVVTRETVRTHNTTRTTPQTNNHTNEPTPIPHSTTLTTLKGGATTVRMMICSSKLLITRLPFSNHNTSPVQTHN